MSTIVNFIGVLFDGVADSVAVPVDDATLVDDLVAGDAGDDEVIDDEPIEADASERPYCLRRGRPQAQLRLPVSACAIGVSSRPRSTMSNR